MSVEPKPSATVVLLRDAAEGLEVLLLERRLRDGSGRVGVSVFPGGKIEARDHVSDTEESARRAAVRELQEEAGLELDAAALMPISRWITPDIAPKRFDTWFFVAAVNWSDTVRVDGAEIGKHRWLRPHSALEAHHRGEIRLAPPTFVTVSWLVEHAAVADAMQALRRESIVVFRPRICRLPEGACILYPGDAGYEDGDPERRGLRHRLWLLPTGYRYERSDELR